MNTSSPAHPPPWKTLPEDGCWTTDASWNEFVARVRNAADADRALRALAQVFPPEWAIRENSAREKHPISHCYVWKNGRFELLDIGLALADGAFTRSTARRLRTSSAFFQTAAELWVGSLLRAAGADPFHEPHLRSQKPGPDWFATWPAGERLAVEVKVPRLSEVDRVLQEASAKFIFAMSRELDKVTKPVRRVILELRLAPEVFAQVIEHGIVRNPALIELVETLGRNVAAAIAPVASATDVGTHSIGPLGSLTFKPIAGDPGLQIGTPTFTAEPGHELSRLVSTIRHAAAQLASVDAPGIAMIDAHDLFVPAPLRGVLEGLLKDEHVAGPALGAALLRWGSNRIDAGVPYKGVFVLRGPDFDRIPEQFWSAFNRCHVGHYHFEPLKDPNEPYLCADPDIEWL
jgi:hypothetical protein